MAVIDSALVQIIVDASLNDCREVAKGVAELVASGMDEPRIRTALTSLECGAYGETPARAQLAALVEEFDEQAWRIQEAGLDEGAEYLAAFCRARAAASVWFALDDDPRTAAIEAAYEAQAALADISPIRALVSRTCGRTA